MTRRMIVGALRGKPLLPGDETMTERERLLGDVLNQIWFAVMVGWSGGLETQVSIHDRMRASVELIVNETKREH